VVGFTRSKKQTKVVAAYPNGGQIGSHHAFGPKCQPFCADSAPSRFANRRANAYTFAFRGPLT
jgi:acetyltransferase-like isoleucine patch superfamily enzyme